MGFENLTYPDTSFSGSPEHEDFLQMNFMNNATSSSLGCFDTNSTLPPTYCNFSLICENGTFVDGECFVRVLIIVVTIILSTLLIIINIITTNIIVMTTT